MFCRFVLILLMLPSSPRMLGSSFSDFTESIHENVLPSVIQLIAYAAFLSVSRCDRLSIVGCLVPEIICYRVNCLADRTLHILILLGRRYDKFK